VNIRQQTPELVLAGRTAPLSPRIVVDVGEPVVVPIPAAKANPELLAIPSSIPHDAPIFLEALDLQTRNAAQQRGEPLRFTFLKNVMKIILIHKRGRMPECNVRARFHDAALVEFRAS
jgi:hypothetical protein